MASRTSKTVSFKLIIWSVPIIALFFVAISGVIYKFENQTQQESARQIGRQAVQGTSIALKNWIDDQIRMASLIAGDSRVIQALKMPQDASLVEAAHDFLKSIHERYPYYENLPLAVKLNEGESFEVSVNGESRTISNGTFITDTVQGKTIGKCGPTFSYIKAIFEGKSHFISQVYPSILRGNPIFVISAPVKDATGKIVGVALVAPQMSYFTELFVDSIRVGNTGFMFFLDDRGMLIAHPKKEVILQKEAVAEFTAVSSKAIAGESEFQANAEGMENFYVSQKIDIPKDNILHEWFMVFGQNETEINAASHSFLKVLGGAGVLFILLFSVGMTLLVRFIIDRPVSLISDALKEGVSETLNSAEQVTTASGQLAEGSTEQAATLEETSASLEQMAAMTQRNAEHAQKASGLVSQNNTITLEANDSMLGLKTSMADISKASEETQKIVKTIDEIAFQTNLLALNAAVEAARAGEAGAGFAVVADEVRNLAMRAADAAKNTAALIDNTVDKIGDGTQMVERTGIAFDKVTQGTAQIKDLIAEIASASNEQAQGIVQINQAVTEIDKVTQQATSTAQDSAMTANDMKTQAAKMADKVNELLALISRNGHVTNVDSMDVPAGTQKGASKLEQLHGESISEKKDNEVKPSEIIPLDSADLSKF